VETIPQLECLRESGCDEYQGYLFSAAVPAEQFAGMLRRDQANPSSKQTRD
jgi:EAL domain-containing protein (putative c-di-GMP-specific phosphodiesterase class I)